MIRISDITLQLGERLLFHGLSWTILPKARVGLVGNNGAGKTTLLRILKGEIPLDSGSVVMPGRLSIGYLPQDIVELPDMEILDFLKKSAGLAELEQALSRCNEKLSQCAPDSADHKEALLLHDSLSKKYEALEGYTFEAIAAKILSGLGFSPPDLKKRTGIFSGGWKMRIHLASLLLMVPDVLLLDEPTNHLDTESMEWLEGWLSSYTGTIVAVSHDRLFLDRICTSIADLSSGTITAYQGNFSKYLEERERRIEELKKQQKVQKEEIARMEEFIERFRYKASKASSVQSRIKRLKKISRIEVEEDTRRVSFHFPPCTRSGLDVLVMEDGEKRYSDTIVFSNASLKIQRGEKIALVGINGAGKSTLSRMLSGTEHLSSGSVKFGYNVTTAFYSQQTADNLDYSKTVWESLSGRNHDWSAQEKRNLLGAFLFSGEDIYKPVRVLSGGEKSRLALLKILMEDANFLILDEPTNHLDMQTKDLFQRALLEYDGTLVIVSHDRYFLDNLATRIVEIASGRLIDYPGNYSEFIEKRRLSFPGNEEGVLSQAFKEDGIKERKRAEAEKRNMLYRKKRKVLERLEPIERSIEELEKEQSERDTLLADPVFLADSGKVTRLLIERSETEHKLETLLSDWEQLMAEIVEIEKTG